MIPTELHTTVSKQDSFGSKTASGDDSITSMKTTGGKDSCPNKPFNTLTSTANHQHIDINNQKQDSFTRQLDINSHQQPKQIHQT
jgi:hypothetical protein